MKKYKEYYEFISQAQLKLRDYLALFPSEAPGLHSLIEHLNADYRQVANRSNMAGHITTSGLVIDPVHAKVLLIRHKTLNRWLQPGGGHFDYDRRSWEARAHCLSGSLQDEKYSRKQDAQS